MSALFDTTGFNSLSKRNTQLRPFKSLEKWFYNEHYSAAN